MTFDPKHHIWIQTVFLDIDSFKASSLFATLYNILYSVVVDHGSNTSDELQK